jgi:hypothetical protein
MIGERLGPDLHHDIDGPDLDGICTWIKDWFLVRPHVEYMITDYTQTTPVPAGHAYAHLIEEVDDTIRLLAQRIERLNTLRDRQLN